MNKNSITNTIGNLIFDIEFKILQLCKTFKRGQKMAASVGLHIFT